MAPSTLPASPSPDPRGPAALESFYRWHATIYDWTRPLILFGRRAAAAALECGPDHLVLDVGCGTGFNLPALAGTGAAVVGIECTDAMRRRAAARLARLGLVDQVALDRRPYGMHRGYEGRADRILFSYSLSMIPAFTRVLHRARLDLRPGGRIAVVDFLDAVGPMAWGLERSHVSLGCERLHLLSGLLPDHDLQIVQVGLWRYYFFCGRVEGGAGATSREPVVGRSPACDRVVMTGWEPPTRRCAMRIELVDEAGWPLQVEEHDEEELDRRPERDDDAAYIEGGHEDEEEGDDHPV